MWLILEVCGLSAGASITLAQSVAVPGVVSNVKPTSQGRSHCQRVMCANYTIHHIECQPLIQIILFCMRLGYVDTISSCIEHVLRHVLRITVQSTSHRCLMYMLHVTTSLLTHLVSHTSRCASMCVDTVAVVHTYRFNYVTFFNMWQ